MPFWLPYGASPLRLERPSIQWLKALPAPLEDVTNRPRKCRCHRLKREPWLAETGSTCETLHCVGMPLLTINSLHKSFAVPEGGRKTIVRIPSFELEPGQQLAIRGESGSGKTTFLHLVAGILAPDSGSVLLGGQDMAALAEHERDRLRANTIGFVFQTFNLLQGFNCLENVTLGMAFGPGSDKVRAKALLERVGLGDRLRYRPRELSSGQQQRVAVARALANRPKLVLADEPTGNLDRKNSAEVLKLIRETCRENGAALLLVSHDAATLAQFEEVRDFSEINRVETEVAS